MAGSDHGLQAHSLQSAAMTLHAVATLGPEALEAKLRIRVLAHLSLAVRSVAVSDLHPLGVALVFNSIVKDEQSRTRVGGSGGVGDVDTAMLEHLLQGVRLWPERPPAAGRSGVGSEHSELGAANVRRRGGGGTGGWQLQSQDIANILNAVARLELVTATDEAVQRLATWAMAIEASVWDAAGISQVLHALSRIANVQSSTLAAIPCQLEQVLEHLTLAAIQVELAAGEIVGLSMWGEKEKGKDGVRTHAQENVTPLYVFVTVGVLSFMLLYSQALISLPHCRCPPTH
jgi:hypothetical protein